MITRPRELRQSLVKRPHHYRQSPLVQCAIKKTKRRNKHKCRDNCGRNSYPAQRTSFGKRYRKCGTNYRTAKREYGNRTDIAVKNIFRGVGLLA